MRADAAINVKSQLRMSSRPPAAVTPLTERDDRHSQGAQTTEHAMDVGDELRECHRVGLQLGVALEVTAGAERPTVAGDEYAANRWVVLDLVDAGVELVHCVPVDRVQLVGPIQPDDGGAVTTLADLGQLELHTFCRRGHRCSGTVSVVRW